MSSVSTDLRSAATIEAPSQATSLACDPEGDLQFICGPRNAEDLVHLPDTPWIITSGKGLHLINIEEKTWQMIDVTYLPAEAAIASPYQDCPSPLQASEHFVHGINVRLRDSGVHELYAVNHVGRESVEVYDLDNNQPVPTLRWKGCIPLPESLFGNAISPLPDGGLVISISYEKTDPKLMEKMMAGETTGLVLEWFPGKGLKKVLKSELSANNGIEASADGEWLYINSSGRGSLTRLPRSGTEPSQGSALQRKTIKVPLSMPDNIRWTPQGTLLVAGHTQTLEYASECTLHDDRVCGLDYAIAEIDPLSMEVINVISRSGTPVFGAVTTAVRIGNELWFGTLRGNRVGYLTVKAQ